MFRKSVILMALCVAVFSLFSGKAYAAAPSAKLNDLLAAYNGERNAQVRYMLFAQQADKEGYNGVASLFRAIARAEQVHYENNAGSIKKLGGTANANIETPVVKSTKENLETALKDKTQKGAGKVDAAHAKLLKKALNNLETWKGQKRDFFVCLVCGNVTEDKAPAICPICGASKEKFTAVN